VQKPGPGWGHLVARRERRDNPSVIRERLAALARRTIAYNRQPRRVVLQPFSLKATALSVYGLVSDNPSVRLMFRRHRPLRVRDRGRRRLAVRRPCPGRLPGRRAQGEMTRVAVLAAALVVTAGCGGSSKRQTVAPQETRIVAVLHHVGLTGVSSARGRAGGHLGGAGCQSRRVRYVVAGRLPQSVNAANPSGGEMFVWVMRSDAFATDCGSPYFHREGIWHQATANRTLVISWIAFDPHSAKKLTRASQAVVSEIGQD
jgi:hypothetical protein